MKLMIISSSQQLGSNSNLVGEVMQQKASMFNEINHIDLVTLNLPFYSPKIDDINQYCPNWNNIEAQLNAADAFVMITPEWNGTASPILKNFLHFLDSSQSANKPVCLVSVVSGINGAYPITELKASAFKNNKLVPIPDHLIIREVESFLADQKSGASKHSLLLRVDYSLNMLYQYAQALKPIQQYANSQQNAFGHGM
ncbi:MAG: NAD(P)H-dependent oxidoreductase [Saccharospirillaceae bacterium]|nr:NAD(P)H-dependent oxidoreductase [Pseudomonadales bacterium]NRB79558.1 NAD(P)H-dependent oxidoreductase [Saccharospirillaceae bacterium]